VLLFLILLFSLTKVFICYFRLNIYKNFYIGVKFNASEILLNPTSVTSGSYSYYTANPDEASSGVTTAFNYYPVMKRFVLNTGITAGQDFNYYAAV